MTGWKATRRSGMIMALAAIMLLFAPGFISNASAEITAMQFGQGFSCGGGGGGGGFYTAGACAGSPADGQVFSYFVCKFEQIINDALSKVYCSIVTEARPAVMAALTMAVLFLGMMFLMGASPFTAKELMVFAAKFSMVMAFATQAEYMIGIGYALFMNVAKEGILIVLNYLFEQQYSTANDVYKMFDDALKQMLNMASADSKAQGGQCKNALFSLMAMAAVALPPVAMLGMYFMIKIVWVMVRAVFGYCQGILGVTFLVTLSPIYVSFALFKPTRALFEKWVEHLISFSFQMVVVFAFLGMAFNIISKMADDVQDYTSLVKPYNREFVMPGNRSIFNMCGVCQMNPPAPNGKVSCKSEQPLEIGQLSKDQNFLHFATVKILSMIIMFYLLDIMMDFVPQLARSLAGAKYGGQLGGGATGFEKQGGDDPVRMAIPGEDRINQALAAGRAGFKGATTPQALIRGMSSAGGEAARGFIDDIAGVAAVAGAARFYRSGSGDKGSYQTPEPKDSGSTNDSTTKDNSAKEATVPRTLPSGTPASPPPAPIAGPNASMSDIVNRVQGSLRQKITETKAVIGSDGVSTNEFVTTERELNGLEARDNIRQALAGYNLSTDDKLLLVEAAQARGMPTEQLEALRDVLNI